MVIRRGALAWVDLGPAQSSAPAKRRPVVVISADPFNVSQLNTVVVVALTSDTRLAMYPGNVFLPTSATGLAKDSVANVTALATVDKDALDPTSQLPGYLLAEIDRGLRLSLGL